MLLGDGLDWVVVFEVEEDELVGRLLARGRADDTEETIRTRFKVYQEQTAPLLDSIGIGASMVEVDGLGEIDVVTERVCRLLMAP